MASSGLPGTLPGGEGRRTVTHENVDNHLRGPSSPSAVAASARVDGEQDGAAVDDVDDQLGGTRDPS
jgi:hypothetical protein